jgi:hypothetical protein
MTTQLLERASDAFRSGYRVASGDTNIGLPADLPSEGTFYGHDYREGFRAARNEQWWRAARRAVVL